MCADRDLLQSAPPVPGTTAKLISKAEPRIGHLVIQKEDADRTPAVAQHFAAAPQLLHNEHANTVFQCCFRLAF